MSDTSDPSMFGATVWWATKRGEKPHDLLDPLVKRLKTDATVRLATGKLHASLFSNTIYAAGGFSSVSVGTRAADIVNVSLNVCRSAVNAVTAKISKNNPKPTFFVKSGDWQLTRKAKKLAKFIEGVFYENDAYSLGPLAMRDATIYDEGGFIKVFDGGGKVTLERVHASEIFVDENEARWGDPQCIYQRKAFDRARLMRMYPRAKDAIRDLQHASDEGDTARTGIADLVYVWEAWRKPSSDYADDGRHVIFVPGATLLDEDWKRGFPFARVCWSRGLASYWGESLVGELRSIQVEINYLARDIQRSHHQLAKSHWMVERGGKVNLNHINNDQTSIIEYTGRQPEVYVPNAVSPELYQHLDRLLGKAYEMTGISQLSAQSMKPAGLDSGEALKTYHDIETERFIVVGREYEKLFLDLARLSIDCAREIAANGEKLQVKARARKFMESIDWSEVDLADDEYDMTVAPISDFPSSPAGRLDFASQLLNLGVIKDPIAVRRLFNFNEFSYDEALETAPHDLLLERINKMIDDGDYFPPEPFQDLGDTIRTTQLAYERAQLDGVPEDRLALLRQYMTDTKALMDRLQPPAPPPPPPGPPGPPGAPPGPPMPSEAMQGAA